MKVEIWHLKSGGQAGDYHKVSTLDLTSVTDEATCDLALIHTSEGSMSQMQDPSIRASHVGDLFVLVDDATTTVHRAYELVKDSTDPTASIKYKAIQFQR